MTTDVMPPQTETQPETEPAEKSVSKEKSVANLDPQIQAIIDKARRTRVSATGTWVLSSVSAVSLWACFTPLNWSPLGWLALVPLMMLVRLPEKTRWMYLACYVTGFVGQVATLQWMRLGDPAMYIAMTALAIYLASYIPLFVGLTRTAVHKLRLPLFLAAPAIWVGLEFFRAHFLTGFSWYYLGHSQYRWTALIQICDLVGVYGVSFVMVFAGACLTMLMPETLFTKLKLVPSDQTPETKTSLVTTRRPRLMVVCSLVLLASVLVYGYYRRAETNFETGPRVALIQGDFTTSMKHDGKKWNDILNRHYYLSHQSAQYQPDLIVWPETMFRYPLLTKEEGMTKDDLMRVASFVPTHYWDDPQVRTNLADLSKQTGAATVIGIDSMRASNDRLRRYNSAVFTTPGEGTTAVYDKVHRVVFGEYNPLQETMVPVDSISPVASSSGLDAGTGPANFEYKNWNFSPIICYEDTVPHLVRDFAAKGIENETPVDCFVNLTNDGWFHGSSELDQHLITAAFRCVETRTPMVRAVNTGISALIDSEGVIRNEPEQLMTGNMEEGQLVLNKQKSLINPETGRWFKNVNAIVVDTVPLDKRSSLYVAYGDWFGMLCVSVVGLSLLFCFVPRKWVGLKNIA